MTEDDEHTRDWTQPSTVGRADTGHCERLPAAAIEHLERRIAAIETLLPKTLRRRRWMESL